MASIIRAYQSEELPENYFRAVVVLLRITGLELEKKESFVYSIYSKVAFVYLTYIYTIIQCSELFSSKNDLNELTDIFSYCMSHIVGIVKVTHLYFTKRRFRFIMESLHQGVYKPNLDRGGPVEVKIIRETVRVTELFFATIYFLVFCVFFAGVLDGIFVYFTKSQEHWKMPFVPLTLIDTTYSPMFELGFLFQACSVIMCANYIISSDMMRIYEMAHLACQFQILQNALRNAKSRAQNLQTKNPERGFEQHFDSILRDCVEHHLGILEFANQLENLISMVVFSIFLSSVFQLCFMLYQASLVPVGSAHFFSFCFYWLDTAVILLMYCYFGNVVTDEASKVLEAINELDWPNDTSLSSKKALIMIIQRAQKPLYLTAERFVPLSLPTFMNIIKGSFSYYMVLKQFNDESGKK